MLAYLPFQSGIAGASIDQKLINDYIDNKVLDPESLTDIILSVDKYHYQSLFSDNRAAHQMLQSLQDFKIWIRSAVVCH